MTFISNLIISPARQIFIWLEGLCALCAVLIKLALAALGKGGVKAALLQASTQRRAFAVLRAFLPNISLQKQVMKCYENTGTAIVTKREDVLDVLSRNEDFEVVYGPRMEKLTAGNNFFLGMQPGWDYQRDTSSMRLAARRSDVTEFILPKAESLAGNLVARSNGRIDLPQDLTLQVPWNMTQHYFGTGGPETGEMKSWTTTLFWYLFGDLDADPDLDAKAMKAAEDLRHYLDATIQDRKANPTSSVDILNRCLALQSANTPGMDDIGIRNNILGLLIGAIPTISKTSCLAMDELLRRPDALKGAQDAARANKDELMAQYIWEALRFNPHNPVIYRRATRDTMVARSSLRAMKVKKGQMVFAANMSAMFDRLEIEDPNSFKTDRPWETYITWGYGMHLCFGDKINQIVIPALLKPLLQQRNLRRAHGTDGQIDTNNTPFPAHFILEFDA